jgi:hypothetical protein
LSNLSISHPTKFIELLSKELLPYLEGMPADSVPLTGMIEKLKSRVFGAPEK